MNIPDLVALRALDALGHASVALDTLSRLGSAIGLNDVSLPLLSEVNSAKFSLEQAIFSEDNCSRHREEQ